MTPKNGSFWDWSVAAGTVHVEVPESLSAAEVDELDVFFDLIKRTLRRTYCPDRLPDTQREGGASHG